MKFCSQCGTRIEEEKSKCNQCGAESVRDKSVSRSVSDSPVIGASRNKKILAGSLLVLGMLLFAVYQYASNEFSPMATVDDFLSAVEAGDIEGMQSLMMTVENGEVKDGQAKWLLERISADKFVKERLEEDLRNQAVTIQGTNSDGNEYQDLGGLSLSFGQRDSHLLFFDAYSLILHPEDMRIFLEHDELNITVDNEKVIPERISGDQYSLGTYYPDVYDVSVVLDTAFGSHEFSETVRHTGEEAVYFSYVTDRVEIFTGIQNADLYVNGEPTEVVLDSATTIFDPVLYDESMRIHGVADTPFGEVQSQTVSLDDFYIELHYGAPDTVKDEILRILYDRKNDGRFLEDIYTSGQPQIITEVAVSSDHMYLMQDSNSADWLIYLGYRETWAEGDPDDEMVEFTDIYETIFSYNDAAGEWGLQDIWLMDDFYSSDWHAMTYDQDKQLSYYFDEIASAEKELYLEDPYYYAHHLINDFHYESVYVNNGGNADGITNYIYHGAMDYKDAVLDYAEYLQGREITQDFNGSTVHSFIADGDDVYRVITEDVFYIHNNQEGTSRLASFETEYELKLTENGFFITNLLSTEELWSEDQYTSNW